MELLIIVSLSESLEAVKNLPTSITVNWVPATSKEEEKSQSGLNAANFLAFNN